MAAPTLVMFGSEDLRTDADMREWRSTLAHGRLLLFPQAGHFPWAEDPGSFFPAAEEFLNGGWPPGAE